MAPVQFIASWSSFARFFFCHLVLMVVVDVRYLCFLVRNRT